MTEKANTPAAVSMSEDKRFGTLITLSNQTAAGIPLKAMVTPQRGSNIFRFMYDSYDIFYYDENTLQQSGFTGNFPLWPIPNRLKGHKYSFAGSHFVIPNLDRIIDKNLVHGFVFDQSWQFIKPTVKDSMATVNTSFDFGPEHPCFSGYPFSSRLSLSIQLEPSGLRVTYSVQNRDSHPMPFGFGLHPLFKLLPDSTVQIPANYVMETDQALIPTGKLIDVLKDKGHDLRKPRKVSSLDLDDVYTGSLPGKWAIIDLPARQFRIHLETSNDFTHTVMYASPGEQFFCLENQTCSTDAFNLLAKGLGNAAHVIVLDPGQVHTGYIKYRVEPYTRLVT